MEIFNNMEQPLILMLECDSDDRHITESSFREINPGIDIVFQHNSIEFFSYLRNCGEDAFPSLILLDMNAVPLNARDIIRELKASDRHGHIPVVVLSEITNVKLVKDCYALGASSFIVKPDTVEQTNKKISSFLKYWFETVELV